MKVGNLLLKSCTIGNLCFEDHYDSKKAPAKTLKEYTNEDMVTDSWLTTH